MKITTAAVIFMGLMMLVRADQLVESVQQALKDEGFYYGEVSGEMNANLTAAIRRYQIRNGLQVTGELNDETLRSLGIKSSGSVRPTTKAASPTPAASAAPNEPPSEDSETANPAPPVQPFSNAPQDQQVFPSNPMGPANSPGTVFADTPFQTAPPAVQRNVIVSAQIALARYGLYREQSSAKTVPTKICASMRRMTRSASSDTQIVARRNFLYGSSSRCFPMRLSCRSSLIAL
jgi:peptidoglycan hydrolase-like protein with peptidoglycan-binding domain